MPKTAKLIWEKIKQAEQAASVGQPVWVKTELEVKQLLEEVTTHSSIFRYRDAEEFYKQAYQEMK